MSVDIQMLKDFQSESKILIEQMVALLEECEMDYGRVGKLEDYGQTVDRIMGGAKSLGMMIDNQDHLVHKIGDYSALCKAVGYKASQIVNNPQFYFICVALLMDATEILSDLVDKVTDEGVTNLREIVSQTLIDRVRWVSSQFSAEYRGSVDPTRGKTSAKMSQDQVDELLKKLGLD